MDFDYEKQLIGIIISFERHLKFYPSHNIHFKQINFIKIDDKIFSSLCANCTISCKRENICSIPTFKKIENGYVFKNDCYYDAFSQKLNFEYRLNKEDCKILNSLTQLVYNIIQFRKKSLIKSFYKQLNENKFLFHYIYFSHLLTIYNALVMFIENYSLFDSYVIELAKKLEPVLNGTPKIIVNYLLSLYYSKTNFDINLATIYRNQAINLITNNDFLKIELEVLILIDNNKALTAYKKLDSFKNNIAFKDNYYAQIFIYSQLTFLSLNLDFDSINSYLPHYKKLISNFHHLFSEVITNTFYNQLAVICYFSNDYLCAAKYFYKVAQKNANLMIFNLFLYEDALKKSDYYCGFDFFKENLQIVIANSSNRILFTYFQKKYSYQLLTKNTASILEDYILENLKDFFPQDSIHYQLLYTELNELVQITKNYKKLNKFNSKELSLQK